LWPSPLVIYSVPTRENNGFLLSFHCTVILQNLLYLGYEVRVTFGKMQV
jgi:hypothetical protein